MAFVAVLATAGAGPAPGQEPQNGPPAASPRQAGPHTTPPGGRAPSAARQKERTGDRPAQAGQPGHTGRPTQAGRPGRTSRPPSAEQPGHADQPAR
ncbi:hypothetical protein AB0K89_30000, partial [Streptomyces cinnamoneus]